MHEILPDPIPETDLDRLRPALDDLINELGATDREAVLLRFFEGRPFADVGAKLSMSENTARMRVERALDKLRIRLARRGVKSTAAALGLVLTNQTSVAMPGGLAVVVSGSALAGAAGTAPLLLPFFIMNKLTAGIVSLVAGAGIAISVAEFRTNRGLRHEIAELGRETQDLAQLREENGRLRIQEAVLMNKAKSEADVPQVQQVTAVGGTPSTKTGTQAAVAKRLDRIPAPIDQIRPVYPYDLKHAGVSGHVIVDFIVDKQGNVLNAFATSSTQPEFESAAVQAVSQWVFQPGVTNGHGVFTHMQVPIVFGSDSSTEIAPDPASPDSAVFLSAFYVKG